MNILQIATTVVGTIMSLAYFPQAYKMYKNKSAANVSVTTFSIFALGTLLWTLYGFSLQDITLIVSFAPGVVGSWLILALTIIYRNR